MRAHAHARMRPIPALTAANVQFLSTVVEETQHRRSMCPVGARMGQESVSTMIIHQLSHVRACACPRGFGFRVDVIPGEAIACVHARANWPQPACKLRFLHNAVPELTLDGPTVALP